MHTHNDYFNSLSSELCTEVNKNIITRDNSQRYDASIVNLRCQSRVERRWNRVRTESSRRLFLSARSAVVPAIAQGKREYYKNQITSYDGTGRLFKLMDNLMERQSDPILPHSLPDADLASLFSDFFSEKITCIRRELDFDLHPCVFSADFDARLMMITTVNLYFEHISLHMLQ